MDTTEELFRLADGDHLLRAHLPADAASLGWTAGDGGEALAFIGTDGWQETPQWLDIVGDPVVASRLLRVALDELTEAGRTPGGFSVPRKTELDGIELATEAETWDFMVWDASVPGAALPRPPGCERVEALIPGPETDAEIAELLAEANPHHSTKPGSPGIEVWGGVRSEETGRLLAVGALLHQANDVPYLASIGTHPDARGGGLGAAVTAWLTRRGAEEGLGLCTLGHYSPNEPARRVYARLGYRTTHEMISASLLGAHAMTDGAATA